MNFHILLMKMKWLMTRDLWDNLKIVCVLRHYKLKTNENNKFPEIDFSSSAGEKDIKSYQPTSYNSVML